MNNTIRLLCTLLVYLNFSDGFSQLEVQPVDKYLLPEPDSVSINYPFVYRDSSRFLNEECLFSFFKKLSSNKEQLNILHIGDSHIQAGILTGTIRQELQKKFGNAGFGHFFPYTVAGTNGPMEVNSYSRTSWLSKRNSKYSSQPIPIGLSGHTLQTYSPLASIKMRLNHPFTFNEVLLFYSKKTTDYKVRLTDYSGRQIADIAIEPNHSTTSSKYTTLVPISEFILTPVRSNSVQKKFTLYGLSCRNTDAKGIIYHSIGVNGAEYRHYNNSEYFFEHTQKLKPDLVIVSMGTNEAYNYTIFSKSTFYAQIDSFVTAIKKYNPDATILLTTPGESYRRVGRAMENNPYIKEVREVLLQYAFEKKIAMWDWYTVMGGEHSVDKWSAAGLTDRYKIHYSAKGYRMQGYYFVKAFLQSYETGIAK